MKYFLIFLFFSHCLFGQNIKGKIIDSETKEPIEDASVYFKNFSRGTTTNRKGYFSLKNNSNYKTLDTILISIIGYHTKKLTISQLEKSNFIVNLAEKTEQLKTVNLQSISKLKKEISFRKLASLKRGIHSFGSELIDNKIYLISGDGSYIEDIGKRALLEVQTIAQSNMSDLLKRLIINPNYETYRDELNIYDIKTNSWTKENRKVAYDLSQVPDGIYTVEIFHKNHLICSKDVEK